MSVETEIQRIFPRFRAEGLIHSHQTSRIFAGSRKRLRLHHGNVVKLNRRDFLKGASAFVGSFILPKGVRAQEMIATENLKEFLAQKPIVLDTRLPEERTDRKGRHVALHCPGCKLIEGPYDLQMDVDGYQFDELLPYRDRTILVVCRLSVRSSGAARFLSSKGFSKVYILQKGLNSLPPEFLSKE